MNMIIINTTHARRVINNRINNKKENILCNDYQAYEDYEDHVDSYVIN